MKEPPFDRSAAHRWFAVTLNNVVWERLESGDGIGDDAEMLIHAAHASVYHWAQVGTVANCVRAECLVANVYAALGFGEAALRHARRCLDLVERHAGDTEDWDLAFALDALARAHTLLGHADLAHHFRRQARTAGDAIASAEERTAFDRWFATGGFQEDAETGGP